MTTSTNVSCRLSVTGRKTGIFRSRYGTLHGRPSNTFWTILTSRLGSKRISSDSYFPASLVFVCSLNQAESEIALGLQRSQSGQYQPRKKVYLPEMIEGATDPRVSL